MAGNKKSNRKQNHQKNKGTAAQQAQIQKALATVNGLLSKGFNLNTLIQSLREEIDYPTEYREDYAPALHDGRLLTFDTDAAINLIGQPIDGAISEACHEAVFGDCESREEMAHEWQCFLRAVIQWRLMSSSDALYAIGKLVRESDDGDFSQHVHVYFPKVDGHERFIACLEEEDLDTIYNQGQPGTREYESRQARRIAKALAESLNAADGSPTYTRRARV